MGRYKKPSQEIETNYVIRTHDSTLNAEAYATLPKNPLHLILDNLRSAFNVGAIFRTADTGRLAEIVTCGYTAHPPHKKLDKTALGTTAIIPSRHFEHVAEAIGDFKQRGITVYALETTSRSLDYTQVQFPKPVALVLGNEALGIQRETLDLCDQVLEIPLLGFKNSLNVATAAGIVVFEVLRQWKAGAP